MNAYPQSEYNRQLYYRLIALWVICEAFAGGIMHAAKLPFAGLIVSSLAITCIVLIAYYVPVRAAIIKATVIVAIFKLMLSPHSPPTAYLAVFFQGLMGQLLLSNKKYFTAASITLAVLSLVESAIQRLLVLIIFSGTAFWKAMNQYIQKLTGEKELTDYSFRIAGIYVIIHALIGILVGIYAARLAKISTTWKNRYPELMIAKEQKEAVIVPKKERRKRRIKRVMLLFLFGLIVLYVQSYMDPKHAIIPNGIIINVLLRSLLILMIWYTVLGPLLMMFIKRILHGRQQRYKSEMNEVMLLLPQTRNIFRQSFKLSEDRRGIQRVRLFLKILLVNILAD